jgi:hypothetical protein
VAKILFTKPDRYHLNSEVEEVNRVLQPAVSRESVPAPLAIQRRQMDWKKYGKHEFTVIFLGSAVSLSDYKSSIHLLI